MTATHPPVLKKADLYVGHGFYPLPLSGAHAFRRERVRIQPLSYRAAGILTNPRKGRLAEELHPDHGVIREDLRKYVLRALVDP